MDREDGGGSKSVYIEVRHTHTRTYLRTSKAEASTVYIADLYDVKRTMLGL